ncbi:MAG: hypothetical protein HRK26_02825 [Rickettsiaceae bacterium H1]|nr:hypothetical protein [Rickettsiaceae bacterium H1]
MTNNKYSNTKQGLAIGSGIIILGITAFIIALTSDKQTNFIKKQPINSGLVTGVFLLTIGLLCALGGYMLDEHNTTSLTSTTSLSTNLIQHK